MLLAAAGSPSYKIVEELGIDVNKVGRWRNHFTEDRFAGIEKDRPRGDNHGGKDPGEQAYNEEHLHSGINFVTPAQTAPRC